MDTRNVLLLTATITPPGGVPLLRRTDPVQRRADYEQALQFYLSLVGGPVDTVVFAENSNADISSLRTLVRRAGLADRVEFLVFDGLDHPPAYGRGYGEFKLIDHVHGNAKALQECGKDTLVWKVTGRYVVRNIERIISRRPRAFDVYCNFRDWPGRWADMYLLAWSPRGYRKLLAGISEHLREDVNRSSPEVRFRDVVEAAPAGVKVVPRFRATPRIDGVRGADNRGYSQGRNIAKFYLRSACQIVAPWLWV
jgi:hypothetical protein